VRPLAADDHRAEFWIRHLRLGVALTEISALIAVVYVLAAGRPRAGLVTLVAVVVMATAPVLLLLPMDRLCRDRRGALVFYGWSTITTVAIGIGGVLDGGAGTPLSWLLVLTLTFAGAAYPPLGVALMGAVIISTYVVVEFSGQHPSGTSFVPGAVLAVFTLMTAWASRNNWELVDQQLLLAQRLSRLADTDELTSCLNRRALQRALDAALSRAAQDRPVSICVLDLDRFKELNDTRGHAAGDQVLVLVAETLLAVTRGGESVSRFGGDEFAVLLPSTDLKAATRTGERLRVRLAAALGPSGVTASIGITCAVAPVGADELLALADAQMYAAKAAGGDRIAFKALPSSAPRAQPAPRS
jgi:diguanylate cyclase (GGDEF)-like protein